MAQIQDTRSIGELFSELTREVTTLLRKEFELARLELSTTASRVASRLGVIVLGAVLACAGLFTIVAALVLVAVELGMPAWAAALVVGVVVLGAGGVMAQQALSALRREDLAPRETVRSLKENAEWAKAQAGR